MDESKERTTDKEDVKTAEDADFVPTGLNYQILDKDREIKFDGPIELLVELVKSSGIDIMNFSLTDIVDQYIDYVQKWKEFDLAYASRYLDMASELTLIKSVKLSASLRLTAVKDDNGNYVRDNDGNVIYSDNPEEIFSLTHPVIYEREQEILSEVKELLLQQFPQQLREREAPNVRFNQPKYGKEDYNLHFKPVGMDDFSKAFKTVLHNLENNPSVRFTEDGEDGEDVYEGDPTLEEEYDGEEEATEEETETETKYIIREQTVDVRAKTKEITLLLREKKTCTLSDFCHGIKNKKDVVSVFLAMLIVLKNQVARAVQNEFNGEIFLTHNDNETISLEEDFLKDVNDFN